jgi:Zn-dependent protease with chaperone function
MIAQRSESACGWHPLQLDLRLQDAQVGVPSARRLALCRTIGLVQNSVDAAGATPRDWAPVPGPVDRVTFAAELRRRRRESWRYVVLSGLAVMITGFPMSAIITPVLLLTLAIVARLVQAVTGLPPGLLRPLGEVARGGIASLEFMIDSLDRMPLSDLFLHSGDRFLPGLIALLLPGAIICVLLWLALQALMIRAGAGGALLALGAREPRDGDLEEHQLLNVVQEMAIAAGLPPPRVLLLDVDVPNAVALGSSPQDATVFVTRRLLDEFDRDETQGILGHLVGSIGNGDLRVALAILAVFQTFGLIMTIVDAPYHPVARQTLWRLMMLSTRLVFRRRAADGAEADLVGAMLTESLAPDSTDAAGEILDAGERPGLHPIHRLLLRARMAVLLPFLLVSLLLKMQQFLFLALLLGPALALTWRARRYLADATAVRLTRNPDGLARGLRRLAEQGGMIPGAQWASHLFVVGPEATRARAERQMLGEMANLRSQSGGASPVGHVRSNWGAARSVAARYGAAVDHANQGSLGDTHAVVVSFHPSLSSRLQRLTAMGATAEPGRSRGPWMRRPLLIALLAPIFLVVGVLLLVVLGLAFMLALFVDEMVILFSLVVVLALLGMSP